VTEVVWGCAAVCASGEHNMGKGKKLELDLQQNATDSLAHAVEHFGEGKRATDLKYAVLHVFHAVELFLKARLRRAHPTLVFEKPEEAGKRSARTVDFRILVRRLRAVGVHLSDSDCNDLNAIRDRRNDIEHHEVELDRNKVKEWIGRAMRFVDRFVAEEMGIRLKDTLPPDTYQTLAEAVYTYEERVVAARAELPEWHPKHNPDQRYAYCPECGEETVPYPDDEPGDDDTVRCRLCNARFHGQSCVRCGGVMLLSEPITRENDRLVCEHCWDSLHDD